MDVTLTVSGRKITLPQNFPAQLTNTEKIDRVKFQCDAEYDGFSLVAVFRNGERGKTYPVTVPADRGFVDVDPRALRRAGHLYIGMFGINGLKVLPTAWSAAIELTEGTATDALDDEETAHVLPGIYERIDALDDAVEELEDAVEELEDAVDGLDVAVEELDEAVDQLDADVDALETTVAGKQDTIADLDTIRSGAAAGATALQSVPIASADNIGGAKFQDYWGIGIFSDGRTYVAPATGNQITFRNNNNRPITPYNMDTAFRTCITDPAQELTDYNKECACNTIGAEYIGAYMKKYAENTLSEPAEYLEVSQNIYGEPFALKDGYIVMIKIPEHGGSGNKSIRLCVNGTGFRSVGNAYFPANKSVSGFRLLKNMLSVEYLAPTTAGNLATWYNMADYFGNNVWGEGYRATFQSAESFGVAAAVGESLPAGTKIQVYTMQTD